MSDAHHDLLRRLAISDERSVRQAVCGSYNARLLDEKTASLVCIAALMATDARESSYGAAIDLALASGAEHEGILAVALGLETIIGPERSDVALPRLRSVLGLETNSV